MMNKTNKKCTRVCVASTNFFTILGNWSLWLKLDPFFFPDSTPVELNQPLALVGLREKNELSQAFL